MLVSLVFSVYNEEENLPIFFKTIIKELHNIPDVSFEIIWVNDGSSDRSNLIIKKFLSYKLKNIKQLYIEFSQNFGHEAAMYAGIKYSSGDAIICMDTDLQHPPVYIKEMIRKYKEGYELVFMKKKYDKGKSILYNIFSKSFYWFINSISSYKIEYGATDFFLLSKLAKKLLLANTKNESQLFIRAVLQNLGLKKTYIEFIAPQRQLGESKYNFSKYVKLILNAIISTSFKPLKLVRLFLLIYSIFSLLLALYTTYNYFWGAKPISGYTTIVLFLSLSFSALFLVLSINSIYLEALLKNQTRKPKFIINKIYKQNNLTEHSNK